MVSFMSSSHLDSQSPGMGSRSGVAAKYHSFHSFCAPSKVAARPAKASSLSSSVIESQLTALSQSEHGFGFWSLRSSTTPPLRKKS